MKKTFILGLAIVLLAGLFTVSCQSNGGGNEDGGGKMLPYNAMLGLGDPLAFREDFLKANRTYGAYYKNENGDEGEGEGEDRTSPEFRTFIITEKNRLDEIFSVCPEIDFEKEMVVMYAYTHRHGLGRERIITSIILNNKNLKITFKIAENEKNDSSMPQTRFLVIKMDRLDIDTAEFTLLNPWV